MKSASYILAAILAAAACAGATALAESTQPAHNKTASNAKLDLLLTKLQEVKNSPKNAIADITNAKTELTNHLAWVAQEKMMAFKNATANEAEKVMHSLDKPE